MADPKCELTEESTEEFGELIKFTISGFIGGILVGILLDRLGFSRSGLGQWIVRTISGEGESILEGLFALRKRVLGAVTSMAEAYGWGKLFGMFFPWLVDGISRKLGIDVYGLQGFYIPFFYAMSDQIGGNISGFLFLRRNSQSWKDAIRSYFSHPVMLSGLVIIFVVPIGLAIARILGFSPSTQILTAVETIIANLCWIPPLIGWISEKRIDRSDL